MIKMMYTSNDSLQDKADYYFKQRQYSEAINLYEKVILEQPEVTYNYCSLGLALLLNGQEEEAQITWMLPISDLDEEEENTYIEKLINILQAEVEKRTDIEEYPVVWAIRQHIREIKPNDINNLLHICYLADKVGNFIGDELNALNIIEHIQSSHKFDLEESLLLQVLEKLLKKEPLHPIILDFADACSKRVKDISYYFYIMLSAAMEVGYTYKDPQRAAKLLEIYLTLDSENLEFLRHLSAFYQDAGEYSKGIEIAKKCDLLSQDLGEKIAATHLVLRGLLKAGGYWQEVSLACLSLEALLKRLITEQPQNLDDVMTLRIMTPAFSIPHIKDTPEDFRNIHNQVAAFFQKNIQSLSQEKVIKYTDKLKINKNALKKEKLLKIGYLSYCFKQHSVGWLARWLFQYHNREKFKVNAYIANYMLGGDPLQEWYANNCTKAVKLGINALEIADAINEDEVDILIDLDSITLDISCAVMAVKPAPIQVTWLGWDASGIPAIDYYIADPYVLPDSAQNYYSEKIWRLPNTYIAVDGFEVGLPTLRRDDLNIPSDAVVYLSAQRGYKRHPETTRWQMKIIREVPNSYFLIKGSADEQVIKQFFYQIAQEEGVSVERLRFLPNVAGESTHRANLSIADIVLDTYPYNGATTTLETLWMGIPIVTRVGEQFVARNSYTMMRNAGITEGIAWTDDEYIEWGVRLGKDETLRQQVAWKLRQSRHSAPLWNAKQFTREMEKAYQQMWQQYVEGS
jgi:predicted O-linked N-acetylglucosamine transferase (SPINDLY family)